MGEQMHSADKKTTWTKMNVKEPYSSKIWMET